MHTCLHCIQCSIWATATLPCGKGKVLPLSQLRMQWPHWVYSDLSHLRRWLYHTPQTSTLAELNKHGGLCQSAPETGCSLPWLSYFCAPAWLAPNEAHMCFTAHLKPF